MVALAAEGGGEHRQQSLDSAAAAEDAAKLKDEVHPLNSMYGADDKTTGATNRALVTIPVTRTNY